MHGVVGGMAGRSGCARRLACAGRRLCEAAGAAAPQPALPGARPCCRTMASGAAEAACASTAISTAYGPDKGPGVPRDAGQMISEMTTSYFRRPLPEHLVAFASPQGRRVFSEALEAGTLENYFDLVGNFTTQTEPAYCGLGSLAMVLNACEVDPGRTWKGVWRWYSDDMLECCAPLDVIKREGITFDQFTCLAACHALDVVREQRWAAGPGAYAQFVEACRQSATEPGLHLVVSFHRAALGQTGVGHFSPVGGYHAGRDAVLVLDVARFKYPSYWVPTAELWRAMEPVDTDTGLPRGYHLLRRRSPD